MPRHAAAVEVAERLPQHLRLALLRLQQEALEVGLHALRVRGRQPVPEHRLNEDAHLFFFHWS